MNQLRLGAAPPRLDPRTIKVSQIIRPTELPPLPDKFDLSAYLGVKDNFMFANDKYGDCVIATRAHQTLLLEAFEQGFQIPITDDEVISEYLKETGGPDVGLVVLDSLKNWRNNGWTIGGKKYSIHAFASVNWFAHDEVKYCIYMLNGVFVTLALPQNAAGQFSKKEPWDILNPGSPEASPASWGYHAVLGKAWNSETAPPPPPPPPPRRGCLTAPVQPLLRLFSPSKASVMAVNPVGPVLMTWGVAQQTTWAWWDTYVSEAYAIIDSKDEWMSDNSPVDEAKLEQLLAEIQAGK